MPIIKKIGLYVLVIVSQCLLPSAYAEQVSDPAIESPLLEQIDQSPWKGYLQDLSRGQAYVGDYVQSTGETIDQFFGDNEMEVSSKPNSLTVYTPYRFYSDRQPDPNINFKLRIDLPRTSQRWKIFISSFDETDQEDQGTESVSKPVLEREGDDVESQIGGRYQFFDDLNHIAHFDMGLKFENYTDPNPFIKLKDRIKFQFDNGVESRTTNTLIVERKDGLGWLGEQVFDKSLDEKRLLRSQTNLYWWQEDEQLNIKQRFVHFEKLNAFRANAYFWETKWQDENADLDLTSTAFGMNWREQLYKDWLFGEIEPKVTWYREEGAFESPVYSLMLMLEMRFYKPGS